MEFHLDAHFSLMTIMSYTAYQGDALRVCVWMGAGTLPAHVRYNAPASPGANKGRIEPENSLRDANYRAVSLKSPHIIPLGALLCCLTVTSSLCVGDGSLR